MLPPGEGLGPNTCKEAGTHMNATSAQPVSEVTPEVRAAAARSVGEILLADAQALGLRPAETRAYLNGAAGILGDGVSRQIIGGMVAAV